MIKFNIFKILPILYSLLLIGAKLKANAQSNVNTLQLKNFYITWLVRETHTDYAIIAKFENISLNNLWFTVGFNYFSPTMNGSNLVVCKNYDNGSSDIQHYMNLGDVSSLLDAEDPYIGLTDTRVEEVEDNVTCSFTRENNITGIPFYVSLEQGTPYYMVAAYGELMTDSLFKNITIMKNHGDNFIASDLLYYDVVDRETNETITSVEQKIPQTRQGVYKNTTLLIHNPFFTLYSTENANSVDFVFSTVVLADNNVWASFGFSNDNMMGDDNVCVCKYSTNVQSVEHYYTIGKSTPVLLDSNNPSIGLSNARVSLADGILTCSFTRLKCYSGCSKYFDLKNSYFILNAAGPTDNLGQIQKHLNRIVTKEKIKITCDLPTTTPAQQITPTTTQCLRCNNQQQMQLPDLTLLLKFIKKVLANVLLKLKEVCAQEQ